LLVDQPEYGTNTPYLVDFVQITLKPKLLNFDEIKALYLEKHLSAAQIAKHYGVSKSMIIAGLSRLGVRLGTNVGRSTDPENYRHHMPPYGFAVRKGRLVPDKSEMRICRLVVELVERQRLSMCGAARELERRGYKNKVGRVKWDHKTIKAILNRWKNKL
jgi:hypothetical protein